MVRTAPAGSTPLRRVNELLAAAHQAAREVHDPGLLTRIDTAWRTAEKLAEREEAILDGSGAQA